MGYKPGQLRNWLDRTAGWPYRPRQRQMRCLLRPSKAAQARLEPRPSAPFEGAGDGHTR